MTTRRELLKSSGVFASLLATGALTAPRLAKAASSDYKAVVCIKLAGGMDCHDTIIPYDAASNDQWAKLRAPLLGHYASTRGVSSRQRDTLVPLDFAGLRDGKRFAVPQEMAPLSTLVSERKLSVVANVGPLEEAGTTMENLSSGRVAEPDYIGSHNHQQKLWQRGVGGLTTTGWGARMIEAMGLGEDPYAMMAFMSGADLLYGSVAKPIELSSGGLRDFRPGMDNPFGSNGGEKVLQEHLYGGGSGYGNLLERDYGNMSKASLEQTSFLERLLGQDGAPLAGLLPKNGLWQQLAMVHQLMTLQSELGVRRQVFVVGLGGFDTHRRQPGALPFLQAELAEAMFAFDRALSEAGLGNSVTTFTLSDFGRTLVPNGDGSDHGWGGHSFVMGGAVNGGYMFGDMPEPVLGHSQDRGRGRLIPTTSLEQYGADMVRWFSGSTSLPAEVFPTLNRFDANAIKLYA